MITNHLSWHWLKIFNDLDPIEIFLPTRFDEIQLTQINDEQAEKKRSTPEQ
jgi:hypothetical protein